MTARLKAGIWVRAHIRRCEVAGVSAFVVAKGDETAGAVLIKVGTLDDPKEFGGPEMAIFTIDKQSFHHLPEGLPSFERTPG